MGSWTLVDYEPVKWSKLDANLQHAIEDDDDAPLRVFVRCQPNARDAALSEVAAITGTAPSKVGKDFITLSVARRRIGRLSEQPWVQAISLSTTLRPTHDVQATPPESGPSLRMQSPSQQPYRASG